MRFGINAYRLSGQRLGVGRYVEYMLKNWGPMLGPGDDLTVYVQEPLDLEHLHLPETCRQKVLKPRLPGLAWENLLLARCHNEIDVLFGPSYTVPITYRSRSVVAIHSLNEAHAHTHPWWYTQTYSRLYRQAARRAQRVIVPSQATKQDLIQIYNIGQDKIDIVAQGADRCFAPIDDEGLKQRTRRRYIGVDCPYILFVGKLSQRRNIPLLMTAFSILKKQEKIPHRLLLFGPNHLDIPLVRMAEQLDIADDVIQTDGRVRDHAELVEVYNAADLYVNASLYEGFSMTLIEAMACGLPVVVSRRAALAEIADGYGVMVDDVTAEGFAGAMADVLSDPMLRQRLRTKSLERAADFRWDTLAQQTLGILRRVGAG